MSERARAATPWDDWLGRSETVEDVITLAPAQLLLATFDDSETRLGLGDPLPPAWHWLYFLARTPQSDLMRDGLAQGRGLLPPLGLPRRMFGGCRISFPAPLPIGSAVRRESTLVDLRQKQGRSGPLVFVDTRHRIFAGDTLCVEETVTGVFREEGGVNNAPQPLDALPPPPAGAWGRDIAATEPFLFRYSALTHNPHRIHYDRPYATGVEGYPGLVVHGPLLASLLLELPRRHSPRRVSEFAFRAAAAVYDIAPFRTQGVPDGDSVDLAVIGPDGATAMTATATLD